METTLSYHKVPQKSLKVMQMEWCGPVMRGLFTQSTHAGHQDCLVFLGVRSFSPLESPPEPLLGVPMLV